MILRLMTIGIGGLWLSGGLHAQDTFGQAREQFQSFWAFSNASASRPELRTEMPQRTATMLQVVRPLLINGIIVSLNQPVAPTDEELAKEIARTLTPLAFPMLWKASQVSARLPR